MLRRVINLPKMILTILLISVIPPNESQMALASSNYFNNPPWNIPSKGERDTHSRTLFTNLSALDRRTRHNASGMESEIAAIFKGVAYGSTTTKSTSKSTTTTTTEMTSTVPLYFYKTTPKSSSFIGKQKEVQEGDKINLGFSINEDIANSSVMADDLYPARNHTYTYLIHSDPYTREDNGEFEDKAHRTPIPVVENFPSFDVEIEETEKIEVRIKSPLKKEGFGGIQEEIGNAWRFHIYVTGITFIIVAIVCLLSLSRVSACSQLLPRGYFITLHLMIFLAAFFRCLLFLHDPYGAYERLPLVLTDLLFNSVCPCITTAYALVLLVLLRAGRVKLLPLSIQSPLMLAIVCGIHIGGTAVVDVSSGVLEDENTVLTLNIITRSFTVTWGIILCLGYVISFTSIEKAAQKHLGDTVRLTYQRTNIEGGSLKGKSVSKCYLTYASRIFLICTLLQGLLIAFIILSLVTTRLPLSPTISEAWAWWTQSSLERLIEIALCVLLLSTALVLTQNKPKTKPGQKKPKIFSMFTNCGKNANGSKSVDVYPVANEKFNILKNGTLTNSTLTSSLNYSTTGWKGLNESTVSNPAMNGPPMLNSIDAEYQKIVQEDGKPDPTYMYTPQLVYDSNTYLQQNSAAKDLMYFNLIKDRNAWKKNQDVIYHPHMNNYDIDRNLEHYKDYNNSPVPLKLNTIRADIYNQKNRNLQHADIPMNQPAIQITTPTSQNHECDYDVSSYYTNSNASTASSNLYSKPYAYYCQNQPISDHHNQNFNHHCTNPKNCNTNPRSEISGCSDQSSVHHVDYLTDASSSNDALNGSLSRSFTLPLYMQNSTMLRGRHHDYPKPNVHSHKNIPAIPCVSDTPQHLINPRICESSCVESSNKVNSSSVNDFHKNQQGFFGKVVNSGEGGVSEGYSPLSLEDTSSPTTVHPSKNVKRSTSTGDLTQSISSDVRQVSQLPSKVCPPSVHCSDPVTCL